MKRVMLAYGSRPEAVKMAPLVNRLRAATHVEPIIVVTAQHREMLDQVNKVFGITPDHDLDVFEHGQTLAEVTAKVVTGMTRILEDVRPELLVVQGDTTTTFAGALAGFYAKTPVAHLEAGLRSGRADLPYPEELNRRLTTQLSALHLAPLPTNRANLEREGVSPSDIVVIGNTVIDALQSVVRDDDVLAAEDRRLIVVTAHRRESWGEPMRRIARAVATLAADPTLCFVVPMHRNPLVRADLEPELGHLDNVTLTEPLDYLDFARLMMRATLVLTDSGGIQEEAPSLGTPVLVMREVTERPEAVTAGTVRVVGTGTDDIVGATRQLLGDASDYDAMVRAVNPYGDGRAAERAVAAIEHFLGLGPRVEEFTASTADEQAGRRPSHTPR